MTVFGNGSQVGTVYDRLFAGQPPAVATPAGLLDEVWSAPDSPYLVAAALLSPSDGAAATLRHA